MKKLLMMALFACMALPIFSQITAHTIKISLATGNSPYNWVYSPNQMSNAFTLSPSSDPRSAGSGSLVNMVGLQVKYFLTDKIAVKFLGGGQTIVTPARPDIPGTWSYSSGLAFDPRVDIPTFAEVKEEKKLSYLGLLGADYYMHKNNVSIYGGVEGGFRYANAQNRSIMEMNAGTAVQEVYGFNGALTFGAEYNAPAGLFVGFEIRPFSYAYTVTTLSPVTSVSQQADNHNFGYFVYPMLHFGVNF